MKVPLKYRVLAACFAIGGGSWDARAQGIPDGKLLVQVYGAYGERTKPKEVWLFSSDQKQKFAVKIGETSTATVPYGVYRIVASTGGSSAAREVVVNQEKVWVRMGLSHPAGDRLWPGGDAAVSGIITPAPGGGEEWWVKVGGVFLAVSREAPVERGGAFRVGGLEIGSYVVEIFEGARLRHAETIEVEPPGRNRPLEIRMGAGASCGDAGKGQSGGRRDRRGAGRP